MAALFEAVDDGCIYFDSAGKSALPKIVEEVGVHALQLKSRPWRGLDHTASDEIREKFASLIKASVNRICICPSTAYAMSLLVSNLIAQKGILTNESKILLLQDEMASAVYPWQHACAVTGAQLVVIDFVAGKSLSDVVDAAITQHFVVNTSGAVSVLAVPCVHWCDGSLLDLTRVNRCLDMCSPRPLLVLDVTQSLGALPLDVTTARPAFMAASVHKWLLSPYGMSLVYVGPQLLKQRDEDDDAGDDAGDDDYDEEDDNNDDATSNDDDDDASD